MSRGRACLAGLSCLVVLAGCGEVRARTTVGAVRQLSVAVPAGSGAALAPLYLARSSGELAAGALQLTLRTQPSGAAALAALRAGTVSLAVASEPELLAARDAGAKLVAVAALAATPLQNLLSLRATAVRRPGQLAGHRVGTSGSALAEAEIATMLATSGTPTARVRVVVPGARRTLASLLAKRRVAAILTGTFGADALTLARGHHATVALPVASTGVPTYAGAVLVVRVGEARSEGPVLRALLQSIVRAMRSARANPTQASTSLAGSLATAPLAFVRSAIASVTAPSSPTFGYERAADWLRFAAWMGAHGLLRKPAGAAAAFTNEFLAGQGE